MTLQTKRYFFLYSASLAISLITAVALCILAYTSGRSSVGNLPVVVLVGSVVATQVFKFAMKRSVRKDEGSASNG